MSVWHYYLSGILYGIFEAEGNSVTYQWLDPLTARFSERSALTPEENQKLLAWSKLDVLAALGSAGECERAFAPMSDEICFGGNRYSMREPGLYAQRDAICPTDLLFREGALIAFISPAREAASVLVRAGHERDTVISRWQDYKGGETLYAVRFAGTNMIPLRNGVRLATDVYLPEGAEGKLPAILVRTCYGKSVNKHMYYRYVQRGYAVVIQDVRGRDDSEGKFIPMYNEIEDGDDTLSWIAAQPWSDGKVGTIGGSYLGYVQWAMAASGNPHLAAMVSIVTAGSAFVDIPRRGGLLTSGTLAWAFAMSERQLRPELMARDDWDELLNLRPLGEIPVKALGKRIPFLDEWLSHPDDDSFWQRADWSAHPEKLRKAPALIVSGWFDDNGMGTTEALELTKDYPKGTRKVILGPWNHNANTRYDIHGVPMGTNALRYDLDLVYLQWFDRHLGGIENSIEDTPAVEYFTLSENCWKTANCWPPASVTPLPLYLGEDHTLLEQPGEPSEDSYAYDPENPAIHVVDMSENELEVPEDYTEVEARPDILCYTTSPLPEDLVLTGEITTELFISSDAVDTDFVVRLTEVDDNGRSIKYADGMLSAKYSESFDQPLYLKKGQIRKLTIRTTKISKRFPRSSRIRLTVTSSAKNFAFPNSNTADGYNSEKAVIAVNTVHYGHRYPSRIVLPVESRAHTGMDLSSGTTQQGLHLDWLKI